MLHYQGSDYHTGWLVACTIVAVPQTLVVFLLDFVPGKVVGELDPSVGGLAQSRERLLELKQVMVAILRVEFH